MPFPIWLHFLPDVPLEELRSAGVAMALTGQGSWHAGMLHRPQEEAVNMLDLANDHWLRNSPPSNKYAWVQLELPAVRLLSVAAMCRRITKLYTSPARGLPYAFRYQKTVFNVDGKILFGKSEHGLTCATFILAVLKSAGVDLLKLGEWPQRDDDMDRHRELLAMLQGDSNVSKAHIAEVAAEVNCVRYRPEEVVGAASSAQLPVSFLDAETAARQLTQAFALRAASSTP